MTTTAVKTSRPISQEGCTASTHERRGPVTMSLLWVTMVSSFPSVLIGFEWYRQRLSFTQVLASLFISLGLLLLYSIPICSIAIKTGLSFKQLCNHFFGESFSSKMSICLMVLFMGWYAVAAFLMADAYSSLCGGKQYLPLLAMAFSFAMALNNFFGFKGIANFAKFVGAPAVIGWIIFMFCKIAPTVPASLAHSQDMVPFSMAFCTVSQFVIGFAIWGNEADYWRHGKAKPLDIGLALGAALFIGQIIFPITGWLIASQTGITESAAATAYLNKFTFGGLSILSLLFIGCQYFAANDSNLYAFAHAFESFCKMSHRKVVFTVSCLAAVAAGGLAFSRAVSALESICALNAVLLPTATILLTAEWFIFRRKHGLNEVLPSAKYSASIAWTSGALLGILTTGIVPGTSSFAIGIPSLQAWLMALAVYIPLRAWELTTVKRAVFAEIPASVD